MITLLTVLSINISYAERGYSVLSIKFCSSLGLIDVEVNSYKIPLNIDLGTTKVNVALSQDILNKCSAEYVSNMHGYFTNYKNEKLPFKKYSIRSLSIGDYQIKNGYAMTFPSISSFTEKSYRRANMLNNGTIGLETFKNFKIIFDYPHKKIIVIKTKIPQQYDVYHWQKFSFHYEKSGAILIDAMINHALLKILLDSGSSLSVVNPAKANIIALPQPCPKEVNIGSHCEMVIANGMDINKYHLPTQPFYLLPSKMNFADATLGVDFFKKHIIFIDFNENVIAVG